MSSESDSILIVAGETSGERHAAGLVREMGLHDPNFKWFGSGGAQMAAAGVEVLFDVSQLAAIGPWEALAHGRRYWKLFRMLLAEARKRRPRLAVLVDFPDFNLNLAPRLKALGLPVCYFIGPQVWAWRPARVRRIQKHVDLMLVIFPFEEDFYRQRGVEAHYVGNPSLSVRGANRAATSLRQGFGRLPFRTPKPERRRAGRERDQAAVYDQADHPPDTKTDIVALLPGSRRSEVEKILPIQLDAAGIIADAHPARFWLLKAPSVKHQQLSDIYKRWMTHNRRQLPLEIHEGEIQQILPQATCAIVKSGTSTLEATILQVPFAMVYRLSWPSWYVARPLVKTDTYCLANWIAGERIIPEFVQKEATGEKIASYIVSLLKDETKRARVKKNLEIAAGRLGDRDAYRQAAKYVADFLQKRNF